MSTWFSAELACPGCGHRFVARLARGVNVERAPAVRDQALAGRLNQPTCSGCDHRLFTSLPLVYTDAPRGQWITVAPMADLERWREAEAQVLAVMRATLATPAAAATMPSTTVRVVFDLDELRERLVIWNAGLDDAAVECVKAATLAETPDLRRSGERVRLLAAEPDAPLVFAAIPASAPLAVRATWTVERATARRILEDPAWRRTMPELFVPGFVSIDRYLI